MSDATSNLPATIDPDSLRAVRSFEELSNLIGSDAANVTNIADVLGDGFSLLNKKERLVDEPFVVLGLRFNLKIDHPNQIGDFVSVYVMTRDEKKYIFNDGSTGIYAQADELSDLIAKGQAQLPLMVRGGLRVSRYEYEDQTTGETKPAETFYFNTDAEAA